MARTWEIEVLPEFETWFVGLTRSAKLEVAAKLELLRLLGPALGRPHVDTIRGAGYSNIKELRIKRDQIRVFFAFDPRRVGVILTGGAKVGNDRFYETMVPTAAALYARHLNMIGR